jgi:NAD(P)-dependent dehydrogenase (short-subunit alcohol dehydrogenase family)
MMKSVAQEVADRKIRVNSIAPRAIKTNINKQARWRHRGTRDRPIDGGLWNDQGPSSDLIWPISGRADAIMRVQPL